MAIYGIVSADGSSWDTEPEDADYSTHEFYTRATNKHDHSVPASVRLDPSISGEMNALIASGKIPHYRTVSDLIRDAIYHRMHFLTHELNVGDEELRGLLAREREQTRLEQARARIEGIEQTLATCQANINDARARNDAWLLDQTRESLERLADAWNEPYRGKARAMLKGM